jgi:hypothetical protein
MALVTFRSKAAGAIIMYADAAQRLLELIGKPMAERGVITSAQVEPALASLLAAIALEKGSGAAADDADAAPPARHVSLAQRAFPLIEMLRAAQRRQVDVTWGI